ncbi:MAG: sodium:proton antiporter [Rehaibacterium terrae]|uniref:sodium:proton antiporter n=1 Tax=Rehaibacterium terrae TaxID=1341696 RepID=UPI00391C207D
MSWVFALALFAAIAAGVFLALSRNLLRCVIGVSIIGSAINLYLFAAGRLDATAPPLVPAGTERLLEGAANPLPQALVLTAIVIGFALTCFSLVLALAIRQRTGSADTDTLRHAEPPEGDDGKPVPLDDRED